MLQTTSIRVIRVRMPLKSRNFFQVNSQLLKLLLPVGRSYLHSKNRRHLTAAWLAQLGERRSAEREVAGSNPGRTNTQGLQITEKKVLPL